jgi:hypothetical protein
MSACVKSFNPTVEMILERHENASIFVDLGRPYNQPTHAAVASDMDCGAGGLPTTLLNSIPCCTGATDSAVSGFYSKLDLYHEVKR